MAAFMTCRCGVAVAAVSVSYPERIAPKYAKETPGKARMHTCLDQYHANKAAGVPGGPNWIQKGDGYYSMCNKKLGGG